MPSISLPTDFNIIDGSAIQLFDYRVVDAMPRNKINLTKNTFSFLLDGTKELIKDNNASTVKNNKFVLITSGNCLMTDILSTSKHFYRSILLFFNKEALVDFLEKHQFDITPSKQKDSFITCEYDTYTKQYVKSLEVLLNLETFIQGKLLQIKFEEIMLYLIQKKGIVFLETLLAENDDVTVRFMNVVERNKLRKLSLQEISFLCNMSQSTFKRTFYKHYEMPPMKWFQERRLEQAAFYLRTLNKRPIDLYQEIGYENLSNFVKAFKVKYGLTPKQYQIQK